MLEVIIENKYGEQFNFSESADYDLIEVSGITPPKANINTSVIATKDGSIFNSSRLENRNIVLTIVPRNNVERSRVNLYKYIKVKQYIKLYFKTGVRDVWTEGYIEAIEGNLYENPQMLQVSIICCDPYLNAKETLFYMFSITNSTFTFPFEITSAGVTLSNATTYSEINVYNPSDDETGVIIKLYARGLALEPTIYNNTTGETFTINYEFQEGDLIELNTRRGEKSITVTSGGVKSNIINNVERGSKWFNLLSGDNIFTYTALHGADDLDITFEVNPIYEGV